MTFQAEAWLSKQELIFHRMATYVANDGERLRPKMVFALCYVTSHFVLDLVDNEQSQEILDYYLEGLEGG